MRKNIQVLKGMPDSQLLPVMHIMRTSLGVRCDYCHVAENNKYWMDDKPAKQTARRMLQMVMEINRANFGGRPVVSCNTCHRGQTEPVSIPAIGQGAFANTTRDDSSAKPPAELPSVDQLIEKYIQALGGRAAIERIKTRYTKLSLQRPKLVNSGTPRAAIINRGETWTMEIYRKAPDRYLAVITSPDGVIQQGFNGATGWIKTSEGQREMNAVEIARIKREADLYSDLKIKERYSKMNVAGRERVNDREAFVVVAQRSADGKTEKLYFDLQSGLLLRRTVFTQTVLGLDPEQTDYEDYRSADGVKIPFTVRVSYLDDNHYGTTRNIAEVRNNVPVDDTKFNPPTAQR